MLASYLGGLQCLAISVSLALLTTCSQALLNSTSMSSSTNSVGPPYGNITSITLASSSSLGYSDSLISPTASGTSPSLTGSANYVSTAGEAITSSSMDLNSSMIGQTFSGAASHPTDLSSFASTTSSTSISSLLAKSTYATSPTVGTSISPSLTIIGENISSSTDSSTSMPVSASFRNGTSTSRFLASTTSSVFSINDTTTSASSNRSSISTPISSVATDLVGNGTSLIPISSSSSKSVSGVLSTRTAVVGSGTGSISSPTTLIDGSSSIVASITGHNTPSTIYGTSIPSGTIPNDNSTSTTPISAAGPTPSLRLTIGTFRYLGCASSSTGFTTFPLIDSSVIMTLDLCVSECDARQFIYAGIFIERCYCGTFLSSDITVAPGQGSCNILCPGDMTELCGGIIEGSERKLKARQLRAGNLLSLFGNLAVNANSTGPSSTFKITSTNILFSSGSGNITIHSSTGIISGTISPTGNRSGNLTASSTTSHAPGTTVTSGIALGNSSAPSGSKTSTARSMTAPFANNTSYFAPSSTTSANFVSLGTSTTASSFPFSNVSSTPSLLSSKTSFRSIPPTSSISSIMSVGVNVTITTTYTVSSITHLATSILTGLPSSSSSAASLGVSGSISTAINSDFISTSSISNSTSFIGYTVTEIVYTKTSICPSTINTIVSGMPAYIVTSSVSTVILTSTIMIPCDKCLQPSQTITLPHASTTNGLSQSLYAQVTNVNEVIVTEIVYTTISTCTVTTDTSVLSGSTLYLVTEDISTLTVTTIADINEVVVTKIVYTTISTCPITISTSILSGSTSYYVTKTISTLTLTATTTARCERCRPGYATVTVMLVGEAVTSNLGSTAATSGPTSPLTVAQSGENSAGSSSCPSCVNTSDENFGAPSSSASITISSAIGAQANVEGTLYGTGLTTVPPESIASATLNVGLETAEIGPTLVSSPTNLIYLTQSNLQGSTDKAGLNVSPTAGVAFTPTTANYGPYFTGGSEQNINNFGQTVSLGLALLIIVLLSMF